MFSFIIEAIQFITGCGIAEVTDVFNNTIGGLCGFSIYRLFCLFSAVKNKQSIRNYVIAQLPLLIVVLLGTALIVYYQNLPYGVLYSSYEKNVIINEYKVSDKLITNDSVQEMAIYQVKKLTKEEMREIAQKYFTKHGKEIDDSLILFYDDSVVYYCKGRTDSIWVDKIGGGYRYSSREDLTKNNEKHDLTADVKQILLEEGIKLPSNACVTCLDNGSYEIKVNASVTGDELTDGNLSLTVSYDGKIRSIYNNIKQQKKSQWCRLYQNRKF